MPDPVRYLPVLACAFALALPARAQLLPVPAVNDVLQTPARVVDDVRTLAEPATDLGQLPLVDRARQIRRLLRRHPHLLDTDPRGEPVLKQRLLAIAPTPDALSRIAGAGFVEIERRRMDELGLDLVVLQAPAALDTRPALALLRQLDPSGSYEFDHLYLRSGGTAALALGAQALSAAPRTSAGDLRIGLVDSGVDAKHPALAKTDVHAWGCDGAPVPDAHGTAVASLLMGGTNAQAEGGALYAADIWCGQPIGGASSKLVEALAWMARERVPVINISLVGPDNALLRRAAQAMLERGYLLVAAVGNDGPSAPPLYPAAYPGVIGVTAVDRRERALPEAGRGLQVDFAAPGSQLRAARPGGAWIAVRGTSFAAPLVAHRAALQMRKPEPGRTEAIVQALARDARDAGPRGRDEIYGLGILEN